MVKKYKTESFLKRALKGIGYSIVAEIMCAFLVITMIVLTMKNDLVIVKVIAGVCTLTVVLGLFFNWAHNAAKADRDGVKFHGKEYDRYMPLKMALTGPVLSYVTLIVLILSKCGVITDIFNIFLLINMYAVPFVDSFTDGRTLEFLTVPGLLGLVLLTLLQPAAIVLTYVLTYKDVDVITKIVYKK
ncbi:MAG: hypothetical protein IJZ72_08585 [Oscillospiraceae bacterium]|nr:hypothetical protein [Oscillospiraceae bacterium]